MTGPERLRPGLYPVEQAIRVEPLEPALPETVLAEAAELLPPEPRRRRSRAGRWFLGSVAAFLVAAVSVQAGFFVADMYQRSLLLGAAMSALLGLAGASGLWWILAELRQLRRLETVERVREEARRLSRSDAHGEAARFLAHVKPLFIDRPGAAERFRRLEDTRVSMTAPVGKSRPPKLTARCRALRLPLTSTWSYGLLRFALVPMLPR